MKKFLLIFLVFCCQLSIAQKIFEKPNPPRAVNDFGNMLAPFQVEALEQKLDAYNDSTSSAIVVITVPNLDGNDIAEVSLKYLRDWGIGTKDKNNGVVILVSKDDHKARIETGYGMEGVLPDITAKEIIDDRMIPAFKENDYYRGFDNAVDAIIQAAAGEYKADASNTKQGGPSFKT
ncbi:MAG: TPM domain-containing protein, partial [Ginsengibacter sp.]